MRLGPRFERVSLGMANVCSVIHIRNIYNFNAHFHLFVVFGCERKRIWQHLKSLTVSRMASAPKKTSNLFHAELNIDQYFFRGERECLCSKVCYKHSNPPHLAPDDKTTPG